MSTYYVKWQVKSEGAFRVNLDSEYDPVCHVAPNLVKLHNETFPAGEPNIRLNIDPSAIGVDSVLIITARPRNMDQFMRILLVADAAKRAGFAKLVLVLPYFPGSRQDRVCNFGESLTVKVFADLINACQFDRVFILSPHSDVTPALLNHVTVDDELQYAERIIRENFTPDSEWNIVSPDAGAGKRVGKIIDHLTKVFTTTAFHLVRCEKVRDVKTGKLSGFSCDTPDLGGRPTIIFDDIVAYGGTFVGLAALLRERNCGKLSIYVSHADCEAGLKNLCEKFDTVYTTNSTANWNELTPMTNISVFYYVPSIL